MTTIIKAADAGEFLALIPGLAGYTPTDSLVLVPFRRHRTAGVMRLDMPTGDIEAFATTAIGLLCRVDAADGVAVVVYAAADDPPQSGDLPHMALVAALCDRADAGGLEIVDALHADAGRWASYLDDRAGVLTAQSIGDQHSGLTLPDVDGRLRSDAHVALAALERAVGSVCGMGTDRPASEDSTPPSSSASHAVPQDPRALDALALLDDLPLLFESTFRDGPRFDDPWRVAAMLWCLNRPALRDIALADWCHGRGYAEQMLDAQLQWEEGNGFPDIPVFLAGEGPRPDHDRLLTALQIVRTLAALAYGAGRAGPLAAAAWLSWACGNSTHAASYARRASVASPGHGLADIVLTMADAGHLPDWAFDRD